MKKFLTKTLSLVLCIAFSGMQMSLATVLPTTTNTTQWAGDVLTGARIQAHTAGLYKVEKNSDLTDATLRFNKNTRIDWSQLNVAKGEKLYFNNGTYGVLNNVLGTSVSKFAGSIKADNGKIIISNPNGILFQGGKFESLGGLVLTTKNFIDAPSAQLDTIEGANFDTLLNEGVNGNDFAVVQIIKANDGTISSFSSPDISIVANGVYISEAEFTSPNGMQGVVLVTADGANFTASKNINIGGTAYKLGTSTNNDSNTMYVANSAFTTNNGSVVLTSGVGGTVKNNNVSGNLNVVTNDNVMLESDIVNGNLSAESLSDTRTIYLQNSTVTGNVNLKADNTRIKGTNTIIGDLTVTDSVNNTNDNAGVQINAATIGGNVKVTSDDIVKVINTKANTASTSVSPKVSNITGGQVQVSGSTMGTTTVKTTVGGATISGENAFKGDLNVEAKTIAELGGYDPASATVNSASTIDVNGALTVKADKTVGFSNHVKANSISLTATNGSVVQAAGNGALVSDDITINATNGSIVALDTTVRDENTTYANVNYTKNSDYVNAMRFGYAIGDSETQAMELSGIGTEVNAKLSAQEMNIHSDADYVNFTVAGGKADIATDKDTEITANGIDELNVTAQDRAKIYGTAGDLTAEAGNIVYLENTTISGDVDLTADCIRISDGTNSIAGNLKVTDNKNNTVNDNYGVKIANTTVGGNVIVTSDDIVKIIDTTANTTAGTTSNITGGQVQVSGSTMGATNVKSTVGGATISGANTFNGNLDVDAKTIAELGGYDPASANVNSASTIDVNGALTVKADKTIGFSNNVEANSISLTATNGSVVQAAGSGKLVSDNITINAANGSIVALDATVRDENTVYAGKQYTKNSDYVQAMRFGYTPGSAETQAMELSGVGTVVNANLTANEMKIHSDADKVNFTVAGGKADIATDKDTEITANGINTLNVTAQDRAKIYGNAGDLTVEAGNIVYLEDTTISGNADLTADCIRICDGTNSIAGNLKATDNKNNTANDNYGVKIDNATIGGNIEVTSPDIIKVFNTTGNTTAATSTNLEGGMVVLENVNLKDTTATSTEGYVKVSGVDTINGNLTVSSATSARLGGYGDTTGAINNDSLTVSGALDVTAKDTVGYSSDVTADTIKLTSTDGSIVEATGHGHLTSDTITLIAPNGYVVGLDADTLAAGNYTSYRGHAVNTTSDYVDAVRFGYIPESTTSIEVSSQTPNGTVTINNGGAISKIHSDADATVVKGIEGITINNMELTADGTASVSDITAVKKNDDTTGNIVVVAGKNATVENITADTDIRVSSTTGDVVADKLTADKENNGVGSIVISGKNTTLTNSQGAAVKETAADKAIATGVTSTNGNVEITSGKETEAKTIASTNGNVTVNAGTTALADEITATLGNVSVTANGAITANDIIATRNKTTDDNTLGNITITSTNGQINADTLTADTHVIVSTTADVIADKLTGDAGEENGIGGVYVSGNNTTLTNSKGAEVIEIAAVKAIATGVTSTNGNVEITSGKATEATTVTSNNGNVIVDAGSTATATTVRANKGNVSVTAKGKATATDVTAIKGDDDTTGNIVVTSLNNDIEIGNLTASTNVEGYALNGNVNVTDSLKADYDIANNRMVENTIGDVILSGKTLNGENFSNTANSNVIIKGANVSLTQADHTATEYVQNVFAMAAGTDERGDVTISVPTENIVLNNIEATRDITIDTKTSTLETADLTHVIADSEWNGVGDLNIKAKNSINANDIGAANITLETTAANSTITVDGAKAHKADKGNNKGNITITANSDDSVITIGDMEAETHITASAQNGTIRVADDLNADYLNHDGTVKVVENGVGDVNLTARLLTGDNFTTTTSDVAIKGANVTMTQTGSQADLILSNVTAIGLDDNNGDINYTVQDSTTVNIADINATHDINLINEVGKNPLDVIFENTITLNDVHADSEENGRGDINLRAKNLVTADNVSAANITLKSTENNVKVTNAKAQRGENDTTDAAQASVAGGVDAGNIVITADKGNIEIGNLKADSDIIATANTQGKTISVIGDLTADNEGNTYGSVILSAYELVGENFVDPSTLTTPSTITIKGANVDLNQDKFTETAYVQNIIASAAGNDNNGDVNINIPTNNVDLNNIHATRDIVVNSGVDANGNHVPSVLDTAKLNTVIADSEKNGIGDLKLTTKNDITANDIGGANIVLRSTDGNIIVDTAHSYVGNQADADAGNISLIADKGNVTLGNIFADTDILGDASNGAINQIGDIVADATDRNGVGTVTLKANDGLTVGNTGVVQGANIDLSVNTGDIVAGNLTAYSPNDNSGDITITTPQGNITVDGASATRDITITAQKGGTEGKGNVTVKNTLADSEPNGVGDLTINADAGATVDTVGGKNVTVTANDDIVANHVYGGDDVTITSNDGKVTGSDLIADHDNDGIGDLTISAKNDVVITADDTTGVGAEGANVTITSEEGSIDVTGVTADGKDEANGTPIDNGNVIITANNGDITADDVKANNDIRITAGGDVDINDVHADSPDNDKHGDLIVKAGGSADINNATGHDVDINADGNIDANTVIGTRDVTIISDNGDVTGTNLIADGDNDGIGDLYISGRDITITGDDNKPGAEGANVTIEAEGDVDVDHVIADGTNEPDTGNVVIIAPDGDVTVNDIIANHDIEITVGGDINIGTDVPGPNNIVPDNNNIDGGELIIHRVNPDIINPNYPSIPEEASKLLNELVQNGVDTQIANSFTPIAFAAEDEDESEVLKRIVKTVFKTPETGIVTITDKFKTMK